MAYEKREENAWIFNVKPTTGQIATMLDDIPAWTGSTKMLSHPDYLGYVIPYSRGKEGPWRLYTTVAGRIKILHDAHRREDGVTELVTEDVAPPEFKGDFVIIRGTMHSPIFGTVSEVATGVTGGSAGGADRTNPLENAMTSWRGRAISALCGAGILPYTGIASVEEIRTAETRDDMAERGFRIVANESAAPERKAKPQANEKTIEDSNIETLKRINKVNNTELEGYITGYCKSKNIEYTEPIMDWLKEQPVTFCNPINAFIKEQRS